MIKFYHQSIFSKKINNGQERKKEGRKKVQKLEHLKDKSSFLSKITRIFDKFLEVLFRWRKPK